MGEILKKLTLLISRIHDGISAFLFRLIPGIDDKFLHFVVIGVAGMLMVLLLYPLFKYLTKKGYYFGITFIYVFSILFGLTLAIEIGQKLTGTGNMEFADIAAGLLGFLLLFLLTIIVIGIIRIIQKRVSEKTDPEQ